MGDTFTTSRRIGRILCCTRVSHLLPASSHFSHSSHFSLLSVIHRLTRHASSHKVTLLPPSPKNYTNVRPSPTYPGTGWANTEFRSYAFRPGVDDEDLLGVKVGGDNASIVESRDSRKLRCRSDEAPSRELQKQFFTQAITGWDSQMAQNAHDEKETAGKKETVDIVAAGDKVQEVIEVSD